jgi:hypothetical protein
MLKGKRDSTWKKSTKKKSNQGNGKYSKHGNKGGGNGGSTPSKGYRKPYRGQGK